INLDEISSTLQKFSEVKGISSFVSGKVLANSAGLNQVINLKGIDSESSKSVYDIEPNIIMGKNSLYDSSSIPKIIIGLRLADRLQSLVGDTITIISPAGIENALIHFSVPTVQKFVVSGIYSSNNNEYDAQYIFCSIKEAQKLFKYGKEIQGVDVRLNSMYSSFEIQEKLRNILDSKSYAVYTWYDFHKELYTVMQIERWTAYIILSLIIAVACFNILGSLSMTVIEKRRDIGILRAMGIRESSIIKIFMYEGILIGAAGTILGSFLGYFICFLQIKYKLYSLDPAQYKIDSLPLEIQGSDFLFIAGISMLLSFFASLYPARKALKVNIIDAIKWE
ncbi:MAG: ABC transporter permease, partial [Ignavibacteriaceae bacterium]|nr:ABC transporter permease [Ignavibacteriaceae bacterium]